MEFDNRLRRNVFVICDTLFILGHVQSSLASRADVQTLLGADSVARETTALAIPRDLAARKSGH